MTNKEGGISMANLVLFTHTFPYNPPSEQFLLDEVKILSSHFNEILIIPVSHSSHVDASYRLNLPNVSVVRLKRVSVKREILVHFFSSILFNKFFWREVKRLRNNKIPFSTKLFYDLFVTKINQKIIGKQSFKLISKYIESEEPLILYAYWMNHIAHGAIDVKKRLEAVNNYGVNVIVRGHGSADIFYPIQRNHFRLFEDELDEVDRFYPVSEAGKKYLIAQGYQESKIIVNRLGVVDAKLDSFPSNQETPFLIVTCSYLNEVKRVHLVVEALSKITNHPIHWVHFGDGAKRSDILEQAEASLPKNISFEVKGFVENAMIMDFYRASRPNLFLNVSQIEGIPVSIMEAISFGIPIIATNVGGTSEIVHDGHNGYLLDVDFDVYKLVDKIQLLINQDFEQYSKISNHAREMYLKYYDANVNFENFLKTLKDML